MLKVKIYAELIRNYKKYRIKSLYGNKMNNFATTESDILSMANRMAAAGTLAGLTNQEILGLATALSSVGIEAEMGGSAMTQTLTAIEKAVATSSDELQGFADIAGMTADTFSSKWRDKPAEALQAFIRGLGELDKKGESATLKLDELGLSGIRQSNMLKSLGLASDTVTKAIDLSNKAWNENKALTDEANKRYETTESKLKAFRNELTDIAIEFGGPLVDALRDALDATRPLIEQAADLAKAFSKLDEEQQQQIVNWGLLAAGAGPTLSILGKGAGVLGSVFKGLGTVSKALGQAKGKLVGIEKASETAMTATGNLTGAVSLLGAPTTWGVLLSGAAAVGLLAWAGEIEAAENRTKTWGTEVDRVQAGELTRFKAKVDDTKQAMTDFASGATEEVDGIKKAFQGLTDEITRLTNKDLSKNLKLAEQMGLSGGVVDALKRSAEKDKQEAQSLSDEVVAIYTRHKNRTTQLSEDEKTIILNAQNELIERRLELEGYSSKEILAIREAMNGDVSRMNKEQARNWLDTTTSWISDEEKSYKKRKDGLKKILGELGAEEVESRKEVLNNLRTLESEHSAKMDGYREKGLIALKKWYDEAMAANPSKEHQDLINAQLGSYLAQMGVSYEEFVRIMNESGKKASETNGILAKDIEGMSSKMKKANDDWRSLIWDEKEMKMKTNASEILKETINSKDGWEQLEFIIKNANLTTNAKEVITQALIETGKWETLEPSLKKLLAVDETAPEVQKANMSVNSPKQKTPASIRASDKTEYGVSKARDNINSVKDKEVTIWVSIAKKASDLWNKLWTNNEKGTNFHPGGLAMVNDQRGPLYKELITLPNGNSFIPEGRDVVLPLPRGTKVLKASDTKKLFPHYANGIGFENTGIARLTERMGRIQAREVITVSRTDDNELQRLLLRLIELTSQNNNLTLEVAQGVNDLYEKPSQIIMDSGVLVGETGDRFFDFHAKREFRNNRLRGIKL